MVDCQFFWGEVLLNSNKEAQKVSLKKISLKKSVKVKACLIVRLLNHTKTKSWFYGSNFSDQKGYYSTDKRYVRDNRIIKIKRPKRRFCL